MSVLDRIVDATRDEVAPPPREVPLAELERAPGGAPRGPPVLRGADAPGRVGHRRAQAPLAVGGRDPRGRDRHRDRQRLRARRRRRAVDPHRGPALRRLARRPARGARAPARCRSCARTSSSTPTRSYESAAAGADAILLIVAALEPARARASCTREARALDLDVLVEVHDEDELERALEVVDADVIGINNRDLTRLPRRRRAHLRAARPTCRRARPSSRSRASTPASSSTTSSASASTPCSSARALMRAPDPEARLRELTGRSATRPEHAL